MVAKYYVTPDNSHEVSDKGSCPKVKKMHEDEMIL